jgi:hypothetical protein
MKYELEIHKISDDLSAGICDTCNNVKEIITDIETNFSELICIKKHIIIEPLPKDKQIIECEFYTKK